VLRRAADDRRPGGGDERGKLLERVGGLELRAGLLEPEPLEIEIFSTGFTVPMR